MPRERIEFRPQPGPQTMFLASQADIAWYGGAAGGGKSFGMILDPLRHYNVSDFGGICFRRTSVQVRVEGGLWDESMKTYPYFGAKPREGFLEWKFPSKMSLSFGNLEHDKDVYNYQGAQIPWIGFDELTHFTETQFTYMISRNRSTSGVKPRIRGTCNPDPDSFVRRWIDWWIDPVTGLAIRERSGIIRWFIRINGAIVWGASQKELHDIYGTGDEIVPKSFTFIAAKLEDNKILMEKDKAYKGNLLALSYVDRMRLLEGNWNIRASAGTMFKQEWFPVIDAIPSGWISAVRFWDRAGTIPHEANKDPDWTRGLLFLTYPDGTGVVADLKSDRNTPGNIETLIKAVASHDGSNVKIVSQQDPGSAGVSEAEHFVRMLRGYSVDVFVTSKDKVTRAKPVSAQAEFGNIRVVRAPWNRDFFSELENFPDGAHDDIVDTLSGAFNVTSTGTSMFDV